jgi:hypothetical protein
MTQKYSEKIIIPQVMDSYTQTTKITKGLETSSTSNHMGNSATSMVLENLVTTSNHMGKPVYALKYLRVTDKTTMALAIYKTTMAIFTWVVFDLFQIHIVIAFAFIAVIHH